MRIQVVLLGAMMLVIGAASASGSVTKVGDTKDACDKSDVVKFQTASGQVSVKANSSPAPFDLPGLTREIYWYCGGSRERSANDSQFNRVKLSRASNGAMQWTFYRATGSDAPDAGNPQTQIGNSKDACDASHVVTFRAKDGTVKLKAGQSVFKELPGLTRELSWKCDDSNERVANPNSFNWVQLERAGNGALQWHFYRLLSVQDDSTGNYLDNVPGDVVIQVPALKKTVPQDGFLKQQLDTFWDANIKDLTSEINDSLKGETQVTITDLTLSTSSQAELRVGDNKDSVLMKYVVHGNTARVTKSPAAFQATFDIELVMFLPRQQTMPLQANRATAFVHHFELHGASAGDDFLAAFAKSRIHAQETNTNSFSQDVKKRVNDALAKISAGLGAPPGTPVVLDATVGTVQACVKISPNDSCTFPRPKIPQVATRRTLDTSHDSCSASKIWIWDYQRGRFVAVAKGGSATIEVDNQRFEWFCGGDTQPDPANDEWATGPAGTAFVQVKRSSSGGQIDWTFQAWK